MMRIAMLLWAIHCSPTGLLPLRGVDAPMPYLAPEAALSYAQVRQAVADATGIDVLASLGDALRSPSFTTTKPGVAFRSWHKTGRSIDLDQRYGWYVVPEGRFYRVWLNGVDITAIFEQHGWTRIPAVGDVPEWWHYEYRTADLTWDQAMADTWGGSETIHVASCWNEPVQPVALPEPERSRTADPSSVRSPYRLMIHSKKLVEAL